jgi:hypothetical protein
MSSNDLQARDNAICDFYENGCTVNEILTNIREFGFQINRIGISKVVGEYVLRKNHDKRKVSKSEYQEKEIVITLRTRFVDSNEEVSINYKTTPMAHHEQVGLLTYCLEEVKKKQSPLL